MRTVEDAAGKRYLLLKRSRVSSLVRGVATGERRYLPNDELSTLEGTSPLETAAASVSEPIRRFVTGVPDARTLGLLVALQATDGLAARALLDADDRCESDLNGLVNELRAAGLVTQTTVDGESGYRLTDEAAGILQALQSATASS